MLRFHFTSADLARIRLATAPDPMWEILLSLHLLRQQAGVTAFGAWKQRVHTQLDAPMHALLSLAPPTGYSPDFLTPARSVATPQEGIDLVLATPRRTLRRDLGRLTVHQSGTAGIRRLADGDPRELAQLGVLMQRYFDIALGPHWSAVQASFEADRALRARSVLDGGSECLLATAHPAIRWQAPVLTVESRYDRDIQLYGRGITLLPSFFCRRAPITLRDPELPPVIVYPVTHEPGLPHGLPPHARLLTSCAERSPLHILLGSTRAQVLTAIARSAATTGELARRLSVSAPAISQHTSVLREAGLIVTLRHRQSVHHSATPLAMSLLEGSARAVQLGEHSKA
ncbi:ArsR/SmtB family transcription factor [Streptomyces sp. NPDC056987]|uniref:ArsR/SmtB family transcription factor n=1 Tax=Streptomyces sp. NPDC056987 TaxID=3345988 RepID=UPI003637B3BD